MLKFLPLALWLLITLLLLAIHFFRFQKLRKALVVSQSDAARDAAMPVSIIIAARNEEANLADFLPIILNQNHPQFEVIVVNDGSTDGSESLLKKMSDDHEHLKVFNKPAEGKKKAISYAIQQAQYKQLLFTDADCWPSSLQWASKMSAALAEKDLVLAHGALIGSKSFVTGLSIFETFQTATAYFAAALNAKPYMGVGRNMAYSKTIFDKANGFKGHERVLSGDDDLFISSLQQVSVKVLFADDTFTYSDAPKTMDAWIQQKRRHYSASFKYPIARKLSLGFEGFLQLFYYLLLPLVLMLAAKQVALLFLMRYILMLYWMKPVAIHFKAWQECLVFPLWEFAWSLLTTLIHLQNFIFGPRKSW